MSYADTQETVEPVLRVLRGTLDFRGRARRTDGVVYSILVTLASLVVGFAFLGVGNFEDKSLLMRVAFVPFELPLVAWYVRRAHDVGLSGWWLLPFPAWMLVSSLTRMYGIDELSLHRDVWYQVASLAVMIAMLCVVFWRPDEGQNRYGPNPRLNELK